MSGKFTANSSNSEPCGCEKQLNICVENCFCVVVRQFKVNVLLTVGFGTNFCSSRKWLSLHQNFRAMRSLFLLLVIVLPFAGTVFAQDPALRTNALPGTPPNGTFIWQRLDIVSGNAINDLLQRQYDQSRKNSTFPGFRVQIYFGSGTSAHGQAQKIKADFSTTNPGTKAYLTFKSPDFIVRVGDFRTKSEALKMQKVLLDKYPGAFIVADEINFPVMITQTFTTNEP
jgi:Sporulation related domain.